MAEIANKPVIPSRKSRGFWSDAARKFARRPLSMMAFSFVVLLMLTALLSPLIVGTRPIVCRYKGRIYVPCLYYFKSSWQNPIFSVDRFRGRFPKPLKEKDPESWAVWPLIYQDPNRPIDADEWPGLPENPTGTDGSPTWRNPFGTTADGVDVFAQLIHGTKRALLVGFVSTGIAALVGIVIGALAGYLRGWFDIVLSRAIEIVMCVPALVLILAMLALVKEPTIWHVMAVLGITGWTGIARLTRAEFMKLGATEFVTSARASGAGIFRIMFRHILPNALAPVLVPISFGIASAVLVESALSFLGVSGSLSDPSWGRLLNSGRSAELRMWWLILFPGAAIFLTVLAYNLIGEGLQEVTDPRLREGAK